MTSNLQLSLRQGKEERTERGAHAHACVVNERMKNQSEEHDTHDETPNEQANIKFTSTATKTI